MATMIPQDLIKKSISDQKYKNSKHRRDLVYKYLDYYSGDNTDQYITSRFKAQSFQEIPPSCFNITRKLIDRMSRIYTLGATRNVNKTYNGLSYVKDFRFKHIEKMTRLLGSVATQITFKQHPIAHYDYNPVYYFDIFTDEADPFTPTAIIYPMTQGVDDVSYTEQVKWVYWDSEYYCIHDEEGILLEEYPNVYGVLPFVFTHREHQLSEFFVAGAYDIIKTNEQANILLTEMNLGMRFHLFGQYAIEGMYAEDNITRAGSDEIMVVPEGANVNILSPKANMDDAIKLLKTMVELTAQNNHLHVVFDESSADRPSSGVALKIKDLERFQDWQDDLDLWYKYEQDFYSIEKIIAQANGFNLPDKMGVDFVEPEYPETKQDMIAWDEYLLAHNMTTEADLMVKYNKDLTAEQAKSILKKNKEANNATKQQSPFAKLLNQTPTTA